MIELIILPVHIGIAIVSVLVATLSMKDTFLGSKNAARAKLQAAWIGTGTTIVSGTLLAVIANVSFGKMCVSMLVFLAAISLSQIYFSLSFGRQTNS